MMISYEGLLQKLNDKGLTKNCSYRGIGDFFTDGC